jgi:hypothetical protein
LTPDLIIWYYNDVDAVVHYQPIIYNFFDFIPHFDQKKESTTSVVKCAGLIMSQPFKKLKELIFIIKRI